MNVEPAIVRFVTASIVRVQATYLFTVCSTAVWKAKLRKSFASALSTKIQITNNSAAFTFDYSRCPQLPKSFRTVPSTSAKVQAIVLSTVWSSLSN